MLFTAALLVLTAAATEASQVSRIPVKRDLNQVNTIMTTVLQGIESFDMSVKNYNGGADISQLQGSADIMLHIIKSAISAAGNMTSLTVEEAQGFQPLSDKLNAAGDKLLVEISANIPGFTDACVCEPVHGFIQEVGDNVYTLMNTISKKFPQGGKGGDEIIHFKGVFDKMESKLSACVSPSCKAKVSTPTKSAGATGVAKPTGFVGSNATAAETGVPKSVVANGASYMSFSAGALVLAVFASIL